MLLTLVHYVIGGTDYSTLTRVSLRANTMQAPDLVLCF